MSLKQTQEQSYTDNFTWMVKKKKKEIEEKKKFLPHIAGVPVGETQL